MMFVRSNIYEKVFYNLGGKPVPGESDIDCLRREVKEEVNCNIESDSIGFLHEFKTEAHGKQDTLLIIRLYKGDLLGRPSPSSEIAEIKYFNSNAKEEQVTKMGKLILAWLHKENLIS
jgi:8-oxo-dGTP pyrophosphatase MutT (NUDIX family)